MLIACWSVKGGSGTTVVAAGLALVLARAAKVAVRLADLGGDLPAVLGLPDPEGPGLIQWLEAVATGEDVPGDALGRLSIDVGRAGLRLVPRGGDGPLPGVGAASVADRLVGELSSPGHTVIDCGVASNPTAMAVAGTAPLSLLVLRPCFLAMRRALAAPVRPSGVVLVAEPERSLRRSDIEDILGVPVRAEVAWDPAVARSADAGLLLTRCPRSLVRALRRAA